MEFFSKIRAWAKRIKRDAVTLWFAYRHPDTPLLVKALCVFVVAYALSPIDLIPDFIPGGYIDDVDLGNEDIDLGLEGNEQGDKDKEREGFHGGQVLGVKNGNFGEMW